MLKVRTQSRNKLAFLELKTRTRTSFSYYSAILYKSNGFSEVNVLLHINLNFTVGIRVIGRDFSHALAIPSFPVDSKA
jgi:hypothetical protein